MSDRGRIRGARGLAVAGAVMSVAGIGWILLGTDYDRALWSGGGALSLLLATFFAVFVWLVIPRQPRNALVWVMAVSGFGSGLYLAGNALAAAIADRWELVLGDVVIPARLPPAAAVLLAVSVTAVYVALFAWLCFGLLLFPDGRLPSPRWRWVAVLCVGGVAAMVASTLWEYRPWAGGPVTEDTLMVNLGASAAVAASVLALVALLLRFRRSTGLARDQFKWVAWGAAILMPFFVAAFFVGGSDNEDAVLIPLHGTVALMLAAYGIAVGRYRLFDIDVVISRTVVYGTLAVGITAVYVAVVAGVGQVVGGSGRPNPVLALPTTAVIAVAFHPVRRRLERAANRIVYGRRATPYEVLSEFSHRVAAADPALLDQVARSLVDGTGAQEAVIWVEAGGEMVRAAQWPEGSPIGEGTTVSFPIEQDGALLGRLTVAAADTHRFPEEDLKLAGEVAAGMALALRNQRLTGVLEARIEDLRASRRRLVAVQDEARRLLERDLHDGAQQQLVALKVKLGLARAIADKEGGPRTAGLLRALSIEADAAVEGLRDFARGVYPPLLEAEGLGAAITAHARRLPVPVAVSVDGVGRYERQVEAAAYFCVVEALQNVADHAPGAEASVRLDDTGDRLKLAVTDGGPGFEGEATGRGFVDMEVRLDAVGGELVVESVPGQGTVVRGWIPVGEAL